MDELKIAEETFRKIAEQFPHLQMRIHTDDPVDLSMDIPQQEGLKFRVGLNLQNLDELHLTAGHFWLEWFPCTDPAKVAEYVEAVTGLLSGRFRILEHYRGSKCVRAELQAPEGQSWRTVGTWTLLWPPFPIKKRYKEMVNA